MKAPAHCILGLGLFCKTTLHTPANLEAGGDGGVLIVCSLRVSYQVVPAGEHLPAEGEVALLSSVPSLICITSHPEEKTEPHTSRFKTISTYIRTVLKSPSISRSSPYVLMTTIRLYPKMPTPTSR